MACGTYTPIIYTVLRIRDLNSNDPIPEMERLSWRYQAGKYSRGHKNNISVEKMKILRSKS